MTNARQEKLEDFVADLMLMLAHGMINRLSPASTYHRMLADADLLSPRAMQGMQELADASIQNSIAFYERLFRVGETASGPPETLDLGAWLDEMARSAGIQVHYAGQCASTVTLDSRLWSTVIHELFKNVEMHGGGKAAVTCTLLDEGCLRIQVQDQGPGLKTYSPEAFSDSSREVIRATRRRQDSPGHGLGLLHARWAAFLLHGDISLDEVHPQGLSITALAPLVRPPSN